MARNGTVCQFGSSRIAARLRPANTAQAISGATGRMRRRPWRSLEGTRAVPSGRRPAFGSGAVVVADEILRLHNVQACTGAGSRSNRAWRPGRGRAARGRAVARSLTVPRYSTIPGDAHDAPSSVDRLPRDRGGATAAGG